MKLAVIPLESHDSINDGPCLPLVIPPSPLHLPAVYLTYLDKAKLQSQINEAKSMIKCCGHPYITKIIVSFEFLCPTAADYERSIHPQPSSRIVMIPSISIFHL